MATDGGDPGGVETAGAAADHHHTLADRGGGELGLPAHAGVHGAGDGLARKHVGHAAQEASDAGGQGLKLPGAGLHGKVGVRDALAAEGDEVRPALLDQELRVLGLREAAHGDDGDADGPLDLGDEVGVEAAVGDAGGPHELIVEVDGPGHVEGVHAALLL